MKKPEPAAPLKDKFVPVSAQECGMEEAFGNGFLGGPSPNEHNLRARPRVERTHDYE